MKRARRLICAALSVLIIAAGGFQFKAYAQESPTVTVAYIDYNNFITEAKDGSYRGYAVDYLNKIAQYTGWNYEFVNMDWPTGYEAVRNGDVDFYCVGRQTEDRQADFDFSLYPICSEEMNLYTMPDREIYYEEYSSFDGFKIGMLQNSSEIDYFNKYAEENSFDYTLVEYPRNEDTVKALENGEIDAMGIVNYSVSGTFKTIGNFGVSPAYMMSRDGSSYMEEFSRAQGRLHFDEPTCLKDLEEKYYSEAQKTENLLLTRDETEYISKAKKITVALSENMAPIEYYDKASNTFRGVSVDMYKKISELTGLEFRFVKRESASVLHSQMEKGHVQLTGALAESANVAVSLKLKQTKSFTDNSFVLVARNINSLTEYSVAAVPAGYPKFKATAIENGYNEVKEYESFDKCIAAVSSGEADLTYIIGMCESFLMDHVKYSQLQTMVLGDTDYGVCFGVSPREDSQQLQTIISKCISAIPNRQVNKMIVENTANAEPQQTFRDFITRNGMMIFIIGTLGVALAAFMLIRLMKTRQKEILNKKLVEHHDFLQHLYNTLPCGIFRYSYEPPHTILSCNAVCARIYGYEGEFPAIGGTPDAVVKMDTAKDFQDIFTQCEEADGSIVYIWPITRRDGSEGYTECAMDVVETEEGKIFQEVFIDVTQRVVQEKQIEKRYTEELTRSGMRKKGLLYTACFDITEQVLTETDIDVPGIHNGMSVEEFVEGLQFELKDLQTEEEMEDFRTRFTRPRMEKAYDDGQYQQSFDLCRRKDDQIQWLRSELNLRSHPVTGHLICFDYVWDITDEHVSDEIVRHLAFADCDSFMSIFIPTGRCLQYEVDSSGKLTRTESVYGKSDIICRMAESMSREDSEEFLKSIDISVVSEKLEAASHYQVYATLADSKGMRQDKGLSYFYTNKDKGILAVTVSDVTEVKASEVRHTQLLANALEAAEKADAAKSQFLSRVSHEMRTPLNAIIGFIELAKDADAEKRADCLASSDIAAKQLLNVINDVLDMSSIESGKMKLANASFNFRHLVSSITNIYGTQCKQKGIDFETRITTPMDDWLVGDELRVNQILINLLGNAVKFTSEGHIWLTISETDVCDDKIIIRFEISDTGCGMSDEMKSRLFRPFEQENATTARRYGGSGLGLSIVKNLVSMMEGTVRVESCPDEGSTFIIDLPFQRSHVGNDMVLSHHVDTLRVLAVDDEETELDYITMVLKRMGLRFTCAAGGSEALEELERAEKEDDMYNVCLIDWRMPEMSGMDTTRKIRQKYGEDVVVIVVSAYDFQQAGDRAKEAGANLFLSKPVFQSSLFDLFMTMTGGKIAEPEEEPQSWDFAGRRVLLVEDNALNQIVAKAYLAKYNVVTELAENGQEAVDMFTASEPGYYGAILMDIQMPVMDGFEATTAIRRSSHPDAGTIHIIAQTADAFNEDITKTLSSGMNAHVAKPIRPEILAKALQKAFEAGHN